MEVLQPQLIHNPFPVIVKSAEAKRHIKRLKLSDGRAIDVHRYACVGKGELISMPTTAELYVHPNTTKLPVLPCFTKSTELQIVPRKWLQLHVTEITSEEHYEAYEALSQYHYRSQDGFGRRAILLLTCKSLDFPTVLGFVEITTPLMNVKNRSELFDAPFSSENPQVHWERWDVQSKRSYINTIARISRMVVHPEVRGIGLSRVLIEHAAMFCEERWHINNQTPMFLEITADMLKFMPFVYSSKMHWIGNSPGNIDRIARDMRYLEKVLEKEDDHWIKRSASKGIVGEQRKNLRDYKALQEDSLFEDRDIEIDLDHVAQLAYGQVLDPQIRNELNIKPEIVEALMPLVRSPKPTYMKGLTKRSDLFIKSRCRDLGLEQTIEIPDVRNNPCCSDLSITNLNLGFGVDTGVLGASDPGTIRRAFGLDREFHFQTGIKDLSLTVKPGEICYVYGSSGSGKTCLLNLISGLLKESDSTTISGSIKRPPDSSIGFLEEDWPDQPLIRAIEAKSLDEGVFALNLCGLAEPRLYLSRWKDLSAGQKYRAQLAKLICSDSNLWILDEFASNLDDATAISVGKNFARAARLKESICIIATVRRSPLINSIQPDVTIRLNQVSRPVIFKTWDSLTE